MRYFSFAEGTGFLNIPNLVTETLPQKIVLGLVDSRGFQGDYHLSPFNFHHFNVESVSLKKNHDKIPFNKLNLNFDGGNDVEGYLSLLQGTGRLFKDYDLGQ